MSNHFNYEIEERNMRNQLKNLETPFKEEAWLGYEAYYKQFNNNRKKQLLPNFNFALNRTVILPLVFGVIIIAFSFLLFNFITIKTKKPSVSEIAELKPSTTPIIVEPQKAVVVLEKKGILKKEIILDTLKALPTKNEIVANSVGKSAINTSNLSDENPVTEKVAKNKKSSKTKSSDVTTKSKKKKRRKGKVEVLESIATPVNLPSLSSGSSEPELR